MQPKIIDCTLREGVQAKQCSFDIEQSALLAKRISAFGIDMLECGHPMISEREIARVRAVVAASSVPVLAHSRCQLSDIDAVLAAGAPWIGLFASINDISLRTKFKHLGKDQVVALFEQAIRYAKRHGLSVRATVEDAGRTSVSDLVWLIRTAKESGADRVCFADSVGQLLPLETYDVLSLLRHEFPDVVFEHHVHNDQGLALACSLEALRAGVNWLSTSCNGIGERAGITDTFQLATLLHTRHGQHRFQLKEARKLSQLVEVFSRIVRSPMQPLVGENAFVHVARLHQLAMLEDPQAYSVIDPALMDGHVALEKDAPLSEQDVFAQPFEKSATELKYHRHGPGRRFVMLDHRLVPSSPYYFIARKVDEIAPTEPGHVDSHIHRCDSVFMFLGDGDGYQGLEVEVTVGERRRTLQSPATVFVPAGCRHTYRFLSGRGTFINFVNNGNYNQSLIEIDDHETI
ncbi:2-isopropylmalate synthase [Chromobacterium phragmitis]|uniref:2-isopropylmalate synthase n=1 Tax=Chromobacterium phragmitis TaxID=2202141 RepID=A0ABV0IZV2_9NEIS|nr:2-isopropylmalate synthase [Chromobacterium phragmitis]AXE28757.1 2-isopropylmalate synthase [Chromobacterium phragmitis]